MVLSTPMGDTALADEAYKSCVVVIEDHELLVDLIVLEIQDFNGSGDGLVIYISRQTRLFPKDGDTPYLRESFYKFVRIKKSLSIKFLLRRVFLTRTSPQIIPLSGQTKLQVNITRDFLHMSPEGQMLKKS